MKKILFATDGSACSKKAGKMAAQLLEAWPEAQLMILHVTPLAAYPVEGTVPQAVTDAELAYAEEVRAETLADFGAWSNRVTYQHRNGSPALCICDAASDADVDLIVVGSHGRGVLDRMILGSVSNAVVHRAKTSVLVIK